MDKNVQLALESLTKSIEMYEDMGEEANEYGEVKELYKDLDIVIRYIKKLEMEIRDLVEMLNEEKEHTKELESEICKK